MPGPLDGIKVIELGIAAVGPSAAKLLGGLGADVLKLEDPAGEMSHRIPPYIKGTAAFYISVNLNKRHITADLKDPDARDKVLALLDEADVFIENMRPGTVDRLGLGYEVLSERNPRLVFASASAYGSSGPMSTFAGADPFVQAFSGWCSTTGPDGGDGEMLRYMVHLDQTTACVVTEAVVHALLARERTGRGQKIEADMLTSALAIQSTKLAEYFATGRQPQPMGSATSTTVPHQAFLCEDRKYIAVAVVEEEQWSRFCDAMGFGAEFVDDPRFATNPLRVEHRAELIPLLAERFASKPSMWWASRLRLARTPYSTVLDTEAVRNHPQVLANGFVERLETPHWGTLDIEGLPWVLHGTPTGPQRPGGLKGEHNDEVFGQVRQHAANVVGGP
jgi:crotonobetainyl-CoA:carnitine CoA-transferase CaiB-like acyl-CoA transferase